MLIQLRSGQSEVLGDHFRAHALVELHAVVSLPDQRAERLAELRGAARGADGDAAHALDATGDRDVVVAADDSGRGEMQGLLRGPACPIHGHTGDRLGPTCGEHGVSADAAGLLTDLADATPQNVVDRARIEVVAFGEGAKNVGGQVDRVDPDSPPFRFPIGVRTASTMTASFMAGSFVADLRVGSS
ncbi:hypothetical protein GCM10020255_106340 [Rhodococcus baikonurensis]